MAIERVALAAAATFLFQLCEAEAPEATIQAEVPAIQGAGPAELTLQAGLPEAAYGGTVVAAGAHPVEVVPYGDGTIHAYVRSPEPPAPADTQITVRVPGQDGSVHPVVLVWDPSQERYRGQLRRVQLAPDGPVDVQLAYAGETYRGRGPRVVVVAPSPPSVQVVEPSRPTVVVERPSSPTVVVERPRGPTVVVERPSPVVVVERPRSPVVVVERPRSPVVVVERPRSPVVVVERPRSPQVVVHAPGPPGVVVRGPRVRHDNGRHLGHRRGNRGRGRD